MKTIYLLNECSSKVYVLHNELTQTNGAVRLSASFSPIASCVAYVQPATSMRGRNWRRLHVFGGLGNSGDTVFLDEFLRHLLAQVHRKEALRQLHSVELSPQGFKDFLPLPVTGQTASRSASYAMLAIQLHVERVKCMAAGREGNADRVVVGGLSAGGVDVVLGLVEFEADLRKVVELGDGVAGNLGLHTTFKDAVEERVDVGFLGEVDERLRIVGGLDCWIERSV